MHVLGTGVPRRLGVARSASSPKAAQALGCSLTPGLRISFGRVTCMARAASMPGPWTLGFLLFCGTCVCVWVVLGLGFRLRPATPGSSDGVCVCLRARSACTPPLLARVCGVVLCAWARVSAAPDHSWLGCLGVCVFPCVLRWYPATRGWGVRCGCVCLGWGFRCAPPLLAGVMGGVCACVHGPLLPRHSRLGCAVWACVFGLGLWLRPTFSGWGVGVCVFVCALRLYPATPGCGLWCGCVCLGSGFVCALPLLAGVFGCVCVLVCALCLLPATPGRAVRCGWVCVGSGFGCAPPLLALVLGCVCVCVRAPLVPGHSWLRCAVWVRVLGLGFLAAPATPGWGVGVCVCLCAHSACTPPLLARVCGVAVCASARVSAAPHHSWLGSWGVCVLVFALCLYPTTPGWGVRRGCVCLGSGFGCVPPLLAGVCVPLCARSACTLPFLVGVCGVWVGRTFYSDLNTVCLLCLSCCLLLV